MGVPIFGNAVLFSKSPLFAEDVQISMSWSSIASKLPKHVPLDDKAKERIAKEAAERDAAWAYYYQRKIERIKSAEPDDSVCNPEEIGTWDIE
jgi:hypothetical protein